MCCKFVHFSTTLLPPSLTPICMRVWSDLRWVTGVFQLISCSLSLRSILHKGAWVLFSLHYDPALQKPLSSDMANTRHIFLPRPARSPVIIPVTIIFLLWISSTLAFFQLLEHAKLIYFLGLCFSLCPKIFTCLFPHHLDLSQAWLSQGDGLDNPIRSSCAPVLLSVSLVFFLISFFL